MTQATIPFNKYDLSPGRPGRLLWWGVGLLGGAVLLGLAILATIDRPFSQSFDDWVRSLLGGAPGDETFFLSRIFDWIGQPQAMLLLPIALIVLCCLRHWRSAIFMFVAFLVGNGLVAQGLKFLVDRTRPAADPANGLYARLTGGDDPHATQLSYPSGHCVTMSVWVVVIAAVLIPAVRRWWWWIGAILMLTMMWQRVFVNAHWATDTMGGIAAGAGATFLVWWLMYPFVRRDFERDAERRQATRPVAQEPAAAASS